MEFSLWAGLVAGLSGTLVMTAMMKGAASAGMTRMPPMSLVQGAMVTDDPDTANKIGMVTHVIVMGTVVFGIIYALLFAGLGTASWLAGLIIGAIHGLAAGGFMAMQGDMHPRMEAAAAFTGGQTVRVEDGGLRIAAPGPFGRNYGSRTPMGIIVGHSLYGLVAALVYGALV